mmetsp:Transcript_33681/g.99243  ORF Transcript_33681/g.99243 Transcript_33681/m.99243 type:complete len:213 (+) Transcript_33681:969-1607(+)
MQDLLKASALVSTTLPAESMKALILFAHLFFTWKINMGWSSVSWMENGSSTFSASLRFPTLALLLLSAAAPVGFHSSSSEELEKILSSESDSALFLPLPVGAVGTASVVAVVVGDARIIFLESAGPLADALIAVAALTFSLAVGALEALSISPRPFEPLPPFTLAFASGMPPNCAFFFLAIFVTDAGAGEAALPFAAAAFLDDSTFFFFAGG